MNNQTKEEGNAVLVLEDIHRVFIQGENKLEVLRGCSLSIKTGEKTALIGPSGSGKSTLLHIAGLLEKPDSGEVIISGVKTSGLNDKDRTALRRRDIGFVYQFHHLLPEFSARENIMIPQMIAGIPRHLAKKRADELLEMVGLNARASHRPARLSGGEQQRIAIARALANNPKILIADEPTGNLDPRTAESVFELLNNLTTTRNLAVLMATHNYDLAKKMDRICELKSGKVLC